MSYDKAKSITLKPKMNKIFVSVASSNVFPQTYEKCEYAKNTDMSFDEKLGELLRDISGGNIHLNNSLYKWNYAIYKANKDLEYANVYSGIYTQGKSLYDLTSHKDNIYYIGETPYCADKSRLVEITQEQANNGDYVLDYESKYNKQYYNKKERQQEEQRIKALKQQYVYSFMKYFNEEHKGKYYLYSEQYGIIKPKGTNGAFYYYYERNIPTQADLLDYTKAFCLAQCCEREKSKVEIRKYEKGEVK